MKKRVLVIDDEEAFGDVLKINLENTEQYEVDIALDAVSGFEMLSATPYDLVLLDILLPKIEGHEALRRIKEISSVPVIVMSSYITQQQRELIVSAGATSTFLKNDPFDNVYSCITKTLEQ